MLFRFSHAVGLRGVLLIAVLCSLWHCQSSADAAQRNDLAAGKFLVAGRDLSDPNFAETVVLLIDYSESSAIGLVINQPRRIRISRVLEEIDLGDRAGDPVFRGGPVSLSGVLAIIRSEEEPALTRRVFDNVYLVNNLEALEAAIHRGATFDSMRVYLGYAGWGAGQLDREVALGSWHVMDADPDAVFDRYPSSLWERLVARASTVLVKLFSPAKTRG